MFRCRALLTSVVLFAGSLAAPSPTAAQGNGSPNGGGGGGGGVQAQGGECEINCPKLAVIPDGTSLGTFVADTLTHTVDFRVDNLVATSQNVTVSCTPASPCEGISPSSFTLGSWDHEFVTVTYRRATGQQTITLWANSSIAEDQGSVTFAAKPAVDLVVPTITSGSRAVVANREPVIRALFTTNGGTLDSTLTVFKWRDTVRTTITRHSRGLLEWQVDSLRRLGIGDSARVTVKACATSSLCTEVTRWVVLPADSKPVVGFSGVPLGRWGGGFSAPFGPGLAVSGAEVEAGFAIPGYVSRGAARSAGLSYSTRQSYPRALVPIDVELPWPAGTPDQLKVILSDGAAKLDSLVVSSPTCATTGAANKLCRVVLQADFASGSYPTPVRKWLTAEVRVTSGGVTHTSADSVEVVVVDRRSTRYGAGWWPSGVLQLVESGHDAVMIGSDGAATIYRGNYQGEFLAPPGNFTALRDVGSTLELQPRGSLARVVFDSLGRLRATVDANGNRDSVAYDGASDKVTTLVDPVGESIVWNYDGAGKLTGWSDPGTRASRVSIDGSNRLVYDSISSPAARPNVTRFTYQSYPGTGTVVLTKRVGVITDTTTVVYDSTFRRRPVQAKAPLVRNEAGTWVNPVVSYMALERQGYGAPRGLDSVYVGMTDPRGHWTRSRLNRWGQAVRTWDSLGMLSRSTYSADGLPLTAESKVGDASWTSGTTGDSTRVYTDYDAYSRPVRSYYYRGGVGSRVRTDSMIYDASHRVIERIDSRGKVWKTGYDAKGNVIRTITPSSDTTRYFVSTTGLLDSILQPGDTVTTRYAYDATWRNLQRTVDRSGDTLHTTTFDALGRAATVERNAKVEFEADWITEWRRTRAWYNAAGQVDSASTERTVNPASWPSDADTLSRRAVRHVYDRAGRDSLRLNNRGIAEMWLYDRLGRIVSHRPWSDSMAVKDSTVYDLAGNATKVITRRGFAITTKYDSRGRADSTVIPNVGTLRRTFGGPQHQLTQLYYEAGTASDPIGGIAPRLGWKYNARGQLVADTSYTGATTRTTTYAYDAYDRLTSYTNALGVWRIGYETSRGYADTLISPMTYPDTLVYGYDRQGRRTGPTVRGPIYAPGYGALYGAVVTQVYSYNATSKLAEVSTVMAGHGLTPSFTPGRQVQAVEQDDAQPMMAPLWIEQRGVSAAVDSLQETPVYDAWRRLREWDLDRNGDPVASETYEFDRAGNVSQATGAAVYDAVTDRLLQRTEVGGTRVFRYDRSGNLVLDSLGTEVRTYVYDVLDRLVAVTHNDSLIARYAYDLAGRRIAKRVYSSATGGTIGYTRFVYHGGQVQFETDSAAATPAVKYVWGLDTDDLVAIEKPGTDEHYYVAQDRLRSVRAVVRRDRVYAGGVTYAPYGELANGTLPGWVRYRWTGREYDAEAGLYYHRARYYAPAYRRFTQEDPIGRAGGENLFAYVGGQVLEARDPSGLAAEYPGAPMTLDDVRSPDLARGAQFCSLPGATCTYRSGIAASSTFGDFADYSFARLRFHHQAAGDRIAQQDQWNTLMWSIDYGMQDPSAKAGVWTMLRFGRFHTDISIPRFRGVAGTGYDACIKGHICINPLELTSTANIGDVAWLVSHEFGHILDQLSGRTRLSDYDPSAPDYWSPEKRSRRDANERRASCYATAAVGSSSYEASNEPPYRCR